MNEPYAGKPIEQHPSSLRTPTELERLRSENERYHECLQDARDFIATTLAGIGDGHRIAELVQDFDYLLKGRAAAAIRESGDE